TMIDTSRGSLYSGLGAAAVGASSPAVPGVYANFRVTDAVFQPRIAAQAAAAREYAATAATQDAMLAAANAYLELLDAVQTRSIAAETRLNAEELARLTADFAESGEGTQADADRARAELALRENNLTRADEAI